MGEKLKISDHPIIWGIVGTGTIAEHFAADIAHCKHAVLAAVCSRTEEMANTFASRFEGVTPYASLDNMLADTELDAIYVAVPNNLHFETAKAVLEENLSVLIEKPLVLASAEAGQLAELAAKNELFIMEALWTRFLPGFVHLKSAIAAGEIGKVEKIECDLAFPQPYSATSRFYDKARGGGALYDLGIYPISLALTLLGSPDRIEGSWKFAESGVDKSAQVVLQIDDAEVTLNCAIDRAGSNIFSVTGSKGSLIIPVPFISAKSVLRLSAGPLSSLYLAASPIGRIVRKLAKIIPFPGATYLDFDYPGYGLQFEIDAASEAIAQGVSEHPAMPMSESIEALQIIEKVLDRPPVGD